MTAEITRAAVAVIGARLAERPVPAPTAVRIAQRLAANPPTKGDRLDEAALRHQVDVAVVDECDYLAGLGIGQIRGFGGEPVAGPTVHEALAGAFGELGIDINDEVAEIAATGPTPAPGTNQPAEEV